MIFFSLFMMKPNVFYFLTITLSSAHIFLRVATNTNLNQYTGCPWKDDIESNSIHCQAKFVSRRHPDNKHSLVIRILFPIFSFLKNKLIYVDEFYILFSYRAH